MDWDAGYGGKSFRGGSSKKQYGITAEEVSPRDGDHCVRVPDRYRRCEEIGKRRKNKKDGWSTRWDVKHLTARKKREETAQVRLGAGQTCSARQRMEGRKGKKKLVRKKNNSGNKGL